MKVFKDHAFETVIISSSEKVFPDSKLEKLHPVTGLSALRGERIQFQVVCRDPEACNMRFLRLAVSGKLSACAKVRLLQWIPCLNPAASPEDPAIITSKPGLFPGPLIQKEQIHISCGTLDVFRVTLVLPEDFPAGSYTVDVELHYFDMHYKEIATGILPLKLEVIDAVLPPQKLACEMWFHPDCLMHYYRTGMKSRRFREVSENYFRNMAEHGLNVLLTPLWTLPLDTKPGGERLTMQLLDITLENGQYSFDFRRLKQWVTLARKCGITHFSFAHIFTQWGLAAAPKIIAKVHGKEKRIFGWDTPSESAEYIDFLNQLFPALLVFLKKNDMTPENTFFHVSDEPSAEFLEKYESCSRRIRNLIAPYKTLDALSHVDFYDRGLVDIPIPATDAVEPFMERNIEKRWIYYCGNWANRVPNRKPGMSSVRNRVLGVLLWVYRMNGFLEWGYNFWASVHSVEYLDPWNFSQLSRIFGNNGGAFAVLPGEDGKPVDTDLYEVFTDGLQDMRALDLLESKIGREKTLAVLNEGMPEPLNLHNWVDDPLWMISLRERINRAIRLS